ncbi:hypothetical protein CR513_09461, partial [Mucuna pruriens]
MVASGLVTKENSRWILSVDGASNQSRSEAGVILKGLNEVLIEQSLHFEFKASNNQAEYEALLAEMRLAKELEAKTLTAKSDSKLVTGQFSLYHVPKEQNEKDDLLSKLTTTYKRGVQRSIIHENISQPTIEEPTVCSIEGRRKWMSPLMEYLKDKQLSMDTIEARKVARDIARYITIGRELYRRDFSFPLLRCIEGKEARYVVKKVHEGVCGTHIGGRALAIKIARASYYWSMLKNDCVEYVKRCDKCQRFAKVTTAPLEQLHSITLPWPFHKWGVDILGPFPLLEVK